MFKSPNLKSICVKNFICSKFVIFSLIFSCKKINEIKKFFYYFNKLYLYYVSSFCLIMQAQNTFFYVFNLCTKKKYSTINKKFIFLKLFNCYFLNTVTNYCKKSYFNIYFHKKYFKKVIKIFNNLYWFHLYTVLSKNFIIFALKNLFFNYVFRDNFLTDKINLYFFETKSVEYLTSALLSNYIVRNIRVGHTLNRIIYPLMRNLSRLKMLFNGWKIGCSGRFKRRGRAQRVWYGRKGVPLNTLIANIDYSEHIIRLRNGICCIKVFLTKKNRYIYFC